jgi:hypothetical protein
MSSVIPWIAAEAERPEHSDEPLRGRKAAPSRRTESAEPPHVPVRDLPTHQFAARGNDNAQLSTGSRQADSEAAQNVGHLSLSSAALRSAHEFWETSLNFAECAEDRATAPENTATAATAELVTEELRREQERRTYRGRTVAMLRRYMRYSIETGRLPSLLGREFFCAKVTSYTVVTFEDRVIFVHDMETCLERLDEFSRQLIARHILQEHDQEETARLLHCNEKTVRRLIPLALDLMSEILLERGLMERIDANVENSCQGGLEGQISVSDCEDSENKF